MLINAQTSKKEEQTIWKITLNMLLKCVHNSQEVVKISERCQKTGEELPSVIVLKNCSFSEFSKLTQKLAPYYDGSISEIDTISNNKPNGSNIRQSNKPHPFHIDGTFEKGIIKSFLLHFEKIDSGGGGESILMATDPIFEKIPERHLRTLLEHPVYFSHRNSKGVVDRIFKTYVLSDNPDKNSQYIFKYASDEQVNITPVNPSCGEAWEALDWLHKQIKTSPYLVYPAQQNDVLIIQNYKVLHGRLNLRSLSSRKVNRVYLGVKSFFTGLEENEPSSSINYNYVA